MTYLLDTDTCIHLLRGNTAVVARAEKHSPADLAISAITHYELLYGMERCPPAWKEKEAGKILQLLEHIRILPFTTTTSAFAATVRASQAASGNPIGPIDILIAATALDHNLPLVTHNLDEFERVSGLVCEMWGEPDAA